MSKTMDIIIYQIKWEYMQNSSVLKHPKLHGQPTFFDEEGNSHHRIRSKMSLTPNLLHFIMLPPRLWSSAHGINIEWICSNTSGRHIISKQGLYKKAKM